MNAPLQFLKKVFSRTQRAITNGNHIEENNRILLDERNPVFNRFSYRYAQTTWITFMAKTQPFTTFSSVYSLWSVV